MIHLLSVVLILLVAASAVSFGFIPSIVANFAIFVNYAYGREISPFFLTIIASYSAVHIALLLSIVFILAENSQWDSLRDTYLKHRILYQSFGFYLPTEDSHLFAWSIVTSVLLFVHALGFRIYFVAYLHGRALKARAPRFSINASEMLNQTARRHSKLLGDRRKANRSLGSSDLLKSTARRQSTQSRMDSKDRAESVASQIKLLVGLLIAFLLAASCMRETFLTIPLLTVFLLLAGGVGLAGRLKSEHDVGSLSSTVVVNRLGKITFRVLYIVSFGIFIYCAFFAISTALMQNALFTSLTHESLMDWQHTGFECIICFEERITLIRSYLQYLIVLLTLIIADSLKELIAEETRRSEMSESGYISFPFRIESTTALRKGKSKSSAMLSSIVSFVSLYLLYVPVLPTLAIAVYFHFLPHCVSLSLIPVFFAALITAPSIFGKYVLPFTIPIMSILLLIQYTSACVRHDVNRLYFVQVLFSTTPDLHVVRLTLYLGVSFTVYGILCASAYQHTWNRRECSVKIKGFDPEGVESFRTEAGLGIDEAEDELTQSYAPEGSITSTLALNSTYRRNVGDATRTKGTGGGVALSKSRLSAKERVAILEVVPLTYINVLEESENINAPTLGMKEAIRCRVLKVIGRRRVRTIARRLVVAGSADQGNPLSDVSSETESLISEETNNARRAEETTKSIALDEGVSLSTRVDEAIDLELSLNRLLNRRPFPKEMKVLSRFSVAGLTTKWGILEQFAIFALRPLCAQLFFTVRYIITLLWVPVALVLCVILATWVKDMDMLHMGLLLLALAYLVFGRRRMKLWFFLVIYIMIMSMMVIVWSFLENNVLTNHLPFSPSATRTLHTIGLLPMRSDLPFIFTLLVVLPSSRIVTTSASRPDDVIVAFSLKRLLYGQVFCRIASSILDGVLLCGVVIMGLIMGHSFAGLGVMVFFAIGIIASLYCRRCQMCSNGRIIGPVGHSIFCNAAMCAWIGLLIFSIFMFFFILFYQFKALEGLYHSLLEALGCDGEKLNRCRREAGLVLSTENKPHVVSMSLLPLFFIYLFSLCRVRFFRVLRYRAAFARRRANLGEFAQRTENNHIDSEEESEDEAKGEGEKQDMGNMNGYGSYKIVRRAEMAYSSPDQRAVRLLFKTVVSFTGLVAFVGEYVPLYLPFWIASYVAFNIGHTLLNLGYVIFVVIGVANWFTIIYCMFHVFALYLYNFAPISAAAKEPSQQLNRQWEISSLLGVKTSISVVSATLAPLAVAFSCAITQLATRFNSRHLHNPNIYIENIVKWSVFIRSGLYDLTGFEVFTFFMIGAIVYASNAFVGIIIAALFFYTQIIGRRAWMDSYIHRAVIHIGFGIVLIYSVLWSIFNNIGIAKEPDESNAVFSFWYWRVLDDSLVILFTYMVICMLHISWGHNEEQIARGRRLKNLFGAEDLFSFMHINKVGSMDKMTYEQVDNLLPHSELDGVSGSLRRHIVMGFIRFSSFLMPLSVTVFIAAIIYASVISVCLLGAGLFLMLCQHRLEWHFHRVWFIVEIFTFIFLIIIPIAANIPFVHNWAESAERLSIALHFIGVYKLKDNKMYALPVLWEYGFVLFTAVLQRRCFSEFSFERILRTMNTSAELFDQKRNFIKEKTAEADAQALREQVTRRKEIEDQFALLIQKNRSTSSTTTERNVDEEGFTRPAPGREHFVYSLPVRPNIRDGINFNMLTLMSFNSVSTNNGSLIEIYVQLEFLQICEDEMRERLALQEARYFTEIEKSEDTEFTILRNGFFKQLVQNVYKNKEADKILPGAPKFTFFSQAAMRYEPMMESSTVTRTDSVDHMTENSHTDLPVSIPWYRAYSIRVVYLMRGTGVFARPESASTRASSLPVRLVVGFIHFLHTHLPDIIVILSYMSLLLDGTLYDCLPCIILFLTVPLPRVPVSLYRLVALYILVGVILRCSTAVVLQEYSINAQKAARFNLFLVRIPVNSTGWSIIGGVKYQKIIFHDFVVFAVIVAQCTFEAYTGACRYGVSRDKIQSDEFPTEKENGYSIEDETNAWTPARQEEEGQLGYQLVEEDPLQPYFPHAVVNVGAQIGPLKNKESPLVDNTPFGNFTETTNSRITSDTSNNESNVINTRKDAPQIVKNIDLSEIQRQSHDQLDRSSHAMGHIKGFSPLDAESESSSDELVERNQVMDMTPWELITHVFHSQKNIIIEYFKECLRGHGGGSDFYAAIFISSLLALAYFSCFYYFIQGQEDGSILTSIRLGILPGFYICFVTVMILLMVIDRVMYVRRASLALYLLSVLLVLTLTIGCCLWAHFICPVHYIVSCIFFLLQGIALFFRFLQLRRGYILLRNHDVFSEYPHISPLNTTYRIFRAIPFLWELRVLVDWVSERTALRARWYRLVEDMYHVVHLRFIDIKDEEKQKAYIGISIPVRPKITDGVVYILLILAVLVVPLFFYSTFNVMSLRNDMVQVSLQVDINDNFSIYSASVMKPKPTNANLGEWLSRTRPPLKRAGVGTAGTTTQFVSLSKCSDQVMTTMTPQYNEILKNLDGSLMGTSSLPFMQAQLNMRRTASSVKRTIEDSAELTNSIVQSKHLSKSETQNLRNIFESNPSENVTFTVSSFYTPFVINEPRSVASLTEYEHSAKTGDYLTCNFTIGSRAADPTVGWVSMLWCISCESLFSLGNDPNKSYKEYKCLKDKIGCYGYDYSGDHPMFAPSQPYFTFVNHKIPRTILLPNIGLVAIYTTIVLAVARLMRTILGDSSRNVILGDMYDPAPIKQLLILITAARALEYLQAEELLYHELVNILRSPEMLLRLTKPRPVVFDMIADTKRIEGEVSTNSTNYDLLDEKKKRD